MDYTVNTVNAISLDIILIALSEISAHSIQEGGGSKLIITMRVQKFFKWTHIFEVCAYQFTGNP